MSKKGSFLKAVIGIGSVAVAGKVVYDKYKNTKEKYTQEEDEFKDEAVKKYNAIAESKVIEIQDEQFEGCEIKAVASRVVLDLSLARIDKDVYINFKSQASCVIIVLPEGINVTCDVEKVASSVKNEVVNTDEDGIPTVYVIGTSNISSVDIIPADFYGEDEDFEDEDFDVNVAAVTDNQEAAGVLAQSGEKAEESRQDDKEKETQPAIKEGAKAEEKPKSKEELKEDAEVKEEDSDTVISIQEVNE